MTLLGAIAVIIPTLALGYVTHQFYHLYKKYKELVKENGELYGDKLELINNEYELRKNLDNYKEYITEIKGDVPDLVKLIHNIYEDEVVINAAADNHYPY
jgi:hypothetical protein